MNFSVVPTDLSALPVDEEGFPSKALLVDDILVQLGDSDTAACYKVRSCDISGGSIRGSMIFKNGTFRPVDFEWDRRFFLSTEGVYLYKVVGATRTELEKLF